MTRDVSGDIVGGDLGGDLSLQATVVVTGLGFGIGLCLAGFLWPEVDGLAVATAGIRSGE